MKSEQGLTKVISKSNIQQRHLDVVGGKASHIILDKCAQSSSGGELM